MRLTIKTLTLFPAFLAFALFFEVHHAFAGLPGPRPTPPASSAAPVAVTFNGSGSANFREIYSQVGSFACAVVTNTSNEDAANVKWSVNWKVRPVGGVTVDAKKFSFSGQSLRTDSSDCAGGFSFPCTAGLSNYEGSIPGLKIQKSGKSGFILSLSARDQLRGVNPSASTCFQSSVFDNAITGGLNNKDITEVRIKITPIRNSQRKSLKFKNKKIFDCTDPAKTQAFLSNTCSITTNLSGTVVVNGKWDVRLLPVK